MVLKRIIVLMLYIFYGISTNAYGVSDTDYMHRMLAEGRYSEAKEWVVQKETSGVLCAPCYFALAQYSLASDRQKEASYYLMKLIKIHPNHKEVHKILKDVRYTDLSLLWPMYDKMLYSKNYYRWIGKLSPNQWGITALVIFGLWIICLVYCKRIKTCSMFTRAWIYIFPALMILAHFCGQLRYSGLHDVRYAMALDSDITLYASPAIESKEIRTLKNGELVHIHEVIDGWYYVEDDSGMSAWVKVGQLSVI